MGEETAATRGITVLRGGVEAVAQTAHDAEVAGFHTAWTPEFYTRSAVVTLARMATRTESIRLGTSIAYATGRSHDARDRGAQPRRAHGRPAPIRHLYLNEAALTATIDGRPAVAHIELGWPQAYVDAFSGDDAAVGAGAPASG